jgi:hypothetical protein
LTKSKAVKGFVSFSMSRLTSLYYNLIKKSVPRNTPRKIIANRNAFGRFTEERLRRVRNENGRAVKTGNKIK